MFVKLRLDKVVDHRQLQKTQFLLIIKAAFSAPIRYYYGEYIKYDTLYFGFIL